MKSSFSIVKSYDPILHDKFYLRDAFSHSVEVSQDSDMYKFMSKFNGGRISFNDIQSAMDSKEYQAVKDKFEFRTYRGQFSIRSFVNTNPIFYNISNCQGYIGENPHKYSDREINLFKLSSYNNIDYNMLGKRSAKRISQHSEIMITRDIYSNQKNAYLILANIRDYEDIDGLLMISFDCDVKLLSDGDISFALNITELVINA